jgi:soluble lytic murein transglycosylase
MTGERRPTSPASGREQPSDLAGALPLLARTRGGSSHRPDGARRVPGGGGRFAAYYGQLARARLGLPALALAAPPATPDKRAEAERLELVRALEILYTLNERALAITLMAGIGEGVDDVGTLSALGELAEQYHDARGMLYLGKAALARGLPLDYYAFPTVGVPRYSPLGPGIDIDSAMLFAIIRQESAFNPADWSSAQAMGLMQVTPEAGRDTCKRFSCSTTSNASGTIRPTIFKWAQASSPACCRTIAQLHPDVRGLQCRARARAGVDGALRRSARPERRSHRLGGAHPFAETRNYVQRVMENLQVYRTRFENDARLTIDADLRRDTRRDLRQDAAAK